MVCVESLSRKPEKSRFDLLGISQRALEAWFRSDSVHIVHLIDRGVLSIYQIPELCSCGVSEMENNSGFHQQNYPIDLPPGFRFHPTDEELITCYLCQKVKNGNFQAIAIRDADLNNFEPWDLPREDKMGDKVLYLFCLRDKKYPAGLRPDRATQAGYWKATGENRAIYKGKYLVGMKKTLVFYTGRAPKAVESNWVMHEYSLKGKLYSQNLPESAKTEWVISRVFEKSIKRPNNVSLQRRSSILQTSGISNANKCRLLDPPPDHRKSTQLRSGVTGKPAEEDNDDPFSEDDLLEEYKKGRSNFLTRLQWISLVLIISALACVVSNRKLRNDTLWELQFWKWGVFVLVLICGRLFSGWASRIVVFFIEKIFLLRKRVLYFVYGLRNAVQNCLWLGLVLVAWNFLFDKKVQVVVDHKHLTFLTYITKILVCLLVGFVLWPVKTLVIKVLASSFHIITYFERIQESLFTQYVIKTLSGRPLVEMQKAEEEEQRIVVKVQKLQDGDVMVPPDLRPTASLPPKSPVRVIGSGGTDKCAKAKSTMLSGNVSKKQDEG